MNRAAVKYLLICTMAVQYVFAETTCGDDVVQRRGGEPDLVGEVVSITAAGVTFRTGVGSAAVHELAWDEVRDIHAANAPTDLDVMLKRAEDVWRARSRLQRGDAAMAELLFERLFETYRGESSETALIVAEGLLRCRLARYELPMAVLPALEVARLRRAGFLTDRYDALGTVYDEATALCPAIPPAWIPSRATERVAMELSRYEAADDEVVTFMAALYARSLDPNEQGDLGQPSRDVLRHSGVRLLRDSVLATDENDTERTDARTRLLRDLRNRPAWAEAWSRFAVGMSYIGADNPRHSERGAMHLSHLTARFSQVHPYLAGLALSELIDWTNARGEHESAASLQMELQRRYVFHPVRLVAD